MVRMGSPPWTAGATSWGHIRATNDQIAADNNGHQRDGINESWVLG
jgi:hypothetical protein